MELNKLIKSAIMWMAIVVAATVVLMLQIIENIPFIPLAFFPKKGDIELTEPEDYYD